MQVPYVPGSEGSLMEEEEFGEWRKSEGARAK